ncbi:MAG: hypothetical protein WCF85_16580, partial [Rhodospirillaceae bacterium]
MPAGQCCSIRRESGGGYLSFCSFFRHARFFPLFRHSRLSPVIPANAGIQHLLFWTPAFAGVTKEEGWVTKEEVGGNEEKVARPHQLRLSYSHQLHHLFRHSRERGNPALVILDPRFRGGDEEECGVTKKKAGESWSGLFRQFFALDKWNP